MYKMLRSFSALFISFICTGLVATVLYGTDDKATTSTSSVTTVDSSESSKKEEAFQAVYGHMDMYFGMMRTKYQNKKQSIFYPTPQWGGFLGVNYNYFRKYFSLGGGVKLGFYKDRGNPSLSKDEYIKDNSTKLTRPLFPMQANLSIGITPFFDKFYFIPKKLITFRGWFGVEYLYGQEQRSSGDEDAYVDKVRLTSLVYGISPWILISFLDQRTSNTLYVINVKSIYISPYMEWTRTLNHSKEVDYDRKIFGVALTFETL